MFASTMTRRFTRLLAAAAILGAAACNDATGPVDDHAEEVDTIRLTINGTTAYDLDIAGNLSPETLVLPVGTATVVATFLDHDGDDISAEIHADEFQLRFTALPTGLIFARTGAFAGAFTATAVGTGTMDVDLFHIEENHPDFGEFTIAVQIGG